MYNDNVDVENLPEDWVAIAYSEHGRWYHFDNAAMSISKARELHEDNYITMVQKRIYTTNEEGKLIPTPIMELLVRKKR